MKKNLIELFNFEKETDWKLPFDMRSILSVLIIKIIYFKKDPESEIGDLNVGFLVLSAYLKRKKLLNYFLIKKIIFKENIFYRAVAKNQELDDKRNRVFLSGGLSKDKNVSISKSFGELLERQLTSGKYRNDTKIKISFEQLSLFAKSVYYPPVFHRFLPQQLAKFSDLGLQANQIISWTEGVDLISKSKAYVPTQICSWLYQSMYKGRENYIAHATTNGSALYFTKDEAIKRALFEAVERDAFLVHWLTQIAPELIDKKTLPESVQKIFEEVECRGSEVYVLNITTNIKIPTLAIATVVKHGDQRIIISAATSSTFEKALNKVVLDMISSLEVVRGEDKDIDFDENKPHYYSMLSMNDRPYLWKGDTWRERFSWFVSGPTVTYASCPSRVAELSDSLEASLDIFRSLGENYSVYTCTINTDITKELGVVVAQVFVPMIFPLYLVERLGTFDSDRLREFAKYKNCAEFTVNPHPHMFS